MPVLDETNELIHTNALEYFHDAADKPAFRFVIGMLALWYGILGASRLRVIVWFEITTGLALSIVGIESFACSLHKVKFGLERCSHWFAAADALCTGLMVLALAAPVTITLSRFWALTVRFLLVSMCHLPYLVPHHIRPHTHLFVLCTASALAVAVRTQRALHRKDGVNVLTASLIIVEAVCVASIVTVFLLALVFGNMHVFPLELPAVWQLVVFVLSTVLITICALEVESYAERNPEQHFRWLGFLMSLIVTALYVVITGMTLGSREQSSAAVHVMIFVSLFPLCVVAAWLYRSGMSVVWKKNE